MMLFLCERALEMFQLTDLRVGVIGLGYVGLPLAVEFGRRFPTVGFDINTTRVAELRNRHDRSLEVGTAELQAIPVLHFADDARALVDCNFFAVTVPTPVDDNKRPDLAALRAASRAA